MPVLKREWKSMYNVVCYKSGFLVVARVGCITKKNDTLENEVEF